MLKLKPAWSFCYECGGQWKAVFNPLLRSQKICCSKCGALSVEVYNILGFYSVTRKTVKEVNDNLKSYYKEWEGECG